MLSAAQNAKRSPEGDLSLQVVMVVGARNDNERTFQIGDRIPERAIACITRRKIASSCSAIVDEGGGAARSPSTMMLIVMLPIMLSPF